MAEEKEIKVKSPLIGAQAQPTTLDKTIAIDIDTNKKLIDNIIEAGIKGGLDIGALEEFTSVSNARDQIYKLIDTMANDSSVSSILKTYAEEVCEVADNGHIVWCESTDPNISKFVNYLLNTMNVDKNIYAWVYCLLKYGDVYLKLFRESDYDDPIFKQDNVDMSTNARQSLHEGLEEQEKLDEAVNLNIHKASDPYSYYVEMMPDPGTMFEVTKYGKTFGFIETPNEENGLDYMNAYNGQSSGVNLFSYKMKTGDVNIYQADDFVHACLDDNFTRFPEKINLFRTDEDLASNTNSTSYTVKRGKSLLIDSYKVWREKSLIEKAILLNRLTKSSIVRNIQVEVGDMPKAQVQATLRRLKELFEQKSAIDTNNGMVEYNNPGPVENNIFTATHNGQGAITVNAVGGDIEVKNLGDLDEWVNKFYAAYGIPKAYFGYTEDGAGFNGGTSLAIISSVFAKSVKRVQNAMLQALTDAINLFLLNKGCRSYLNNFVLKMKTPITQEELDSRANFSDRINAISSFQALFGDIEDKVRRLKVLKELVSTLNYGDGLIEIIQEEIDATKVAEKENEENENAENNETGGENDIDLGAVDTGSEETGAEDLDLGNSGDVELAAESFGEHSGEILTEKVDFLAESDDLPTPEELNSTKDFTKNE